MQVSPQIITVEKSGVLHRFVPHDKDTDRFVTEVFKSWEPETFTIFEQCKNPEGIAIDLGAWIGTSAIWLSKNFKHVLAVESDRVSLSCLKKNLAASECVNVTLCEKPISNMTEQVTFGPRGTTLNESISYIKKHADSPLDYTTTSITLKQLIHDYIYQDPALAHLPISFIKCDIEGGEENIIEDLLYFAYYNNVQVHLSFHPDFFQKYTLSDFVYLFEFFTARTIDGTVSDIITYLAENPLGLLLFESTYQQTGRPLIKKNMPVFIVAYNQYTYVRTMVDQLKPYTNDIIIIDNNSTFQPLLDYYETGFTGTLLRQKENEGKDVYMSPIIQLLVGDIYLLTDPDLLFNKDLPTTWISDLIHILSMYPVDRVGFALDISSPNIRTDVTFRGQSIKEWEQRFWDYKISDPDYELYNADIDTTLCLVHKKRFSGAHIRVAGPYTCEHLPWYTNHKEKLPEQEVQYYLSGNRVTNWF